MTTTEEKSRPEAEMNHEEKVGQVTTAEPSELQPAGDATGPSWEADLDDYPLREKAEDPRWAVRTVWIWVGFALISITFILVLLVLGAIYD